MRKKPIATFFGVFNNQRTTGVCWINQNGELCLEFQGCLSKRKLSEFINKKKRYIISE